MNYETKELNVVSEHIDISEWCGEGVRYAMETPFVSNGWRYATNGMWAIRVPADGETNTPDPLPKRFPPAADHFRGLDVVQDWQPWPESTAVPQKRECLKCEGSKAAAVEECKECGGDGEVECSHCGSWIDCDECDGSGEIRIGKCDACDGTGTQMRPYKQTVGTVEIQYTVDQLVRKLPNPRFHNSDQSNEMLYVSFDGGQAVIMPLAKWGD